MVSNYYEILYLRENGSHRMPAALRINVAFVNSITVPSKLQYIFSTNYVSVNIDT